MLVLTGLPSSGYALEISCPVMVIIGGIGNGALVMNESTGD
jgi:hypothetical protein